MLQAKMCVLKMNLDILRQQYVRVMKRQRETHNGVVRRAKQRNNEQSSSEFDSMSLTRISQAEIHMAINGRQGISWLALRSISSTRLVIL